MMFSSISPENHTGISFFSLFIGGGTSKSLNSGGLYRRNRRELQTTDVDLYRL